MIDEKGFSLLHTACFKNSDELAIKLMEKVYQVEDMESFIQWINLKTDQDGFTALHFAAFRGNLILIKLFVKYGADINAVNNFGINVVHIAA